MEQTKLSIQQIPSTLRRSFSAQLRGFQKAMKSLRRNPNPVHVHELRVRTRRLQALLAIAAAGHPGKEIHEAQRDLDKLTHSLGQIRRWDVAQADARRYRVPLRTRKKRQKAKKRNQILVRGKKAKKLLKELRLASDSLQDLSLKKTADGLRNLSEKIAKYQNREIRSMKELHQLRILLKRLQYTFEALGREVPATQILQHQIGRGHDLDFLQKQVRKKRQLREDRDCLAKKARKMIPTVLSSARDELNSLTRN